MRNASKAGSAGRKSVLIGILCALMIIGGLTAAVVVCLADF